MSFMNDKHVSNTLGRTFLLEFANTYVKRKAKTVIWKLHYYIKKETGKNCTTNKKKRLRE